jgi:putative NIF3 family GTP cyclohydrolase 1 type 2
MEIHSLQNKFQSLFNHATLSQQPDEWGWRIPSGLEQVMTIGYATSLSPQIVWAAHEQQVQLVVTHHDAWDFLHELREQSLKLLDEFAIAHLFVHAHLDWAGFGTSASLLKWIGCHETGCFDREGDMHWGRYGELSTPVPFADFERNVSGLLGEAPRISLPGSGEVQRVATVTGGGCSTDELKEAHGLGCDTYITGESSLYFLMYARYLQMNVLVYSHTATEIHGVEALVSRLVTDNPEIKVTRLAEAML